MVGEFLDLCNICVHEDGCMNRGTPDRPKLFCEQFELEMLEPAAWEDDALCDGPDNAVEEGKFRGLCCNCENRHTCKISMPEGDIWHCEEYC